MNIELVGFYKKFEPKSGENNRNWVGTLHIYIVDDEMDIRGIRVVEKDGVLSFYMPRVTTTDEFGRVTWYPVIDWKNKEKRRKIIDYLNSEAQYPIKRILSGDAKDLRG